MALALKDGLEDPGVPVVMKSLQTSHVSQVVTEILDAKLVLLYVLASTTGRYHQMQSS